MRLERYTVHGEDQWGKPMVETIHVPRYNLIERAWRWIAFLTWRRPRTITGITALLLLLAPSMAMGEVCTDPDRNGSRLCTSDQGHTWLYKDFNGNAWINTSSTWNILPASSGTTSVFIGNGHIDSGDSEAYPVRTPETATPAPKPPEAATRAADIGHGTHELDRIGWGIKP